MPPVDVLLVVAGQDRGARFGLLGTEATIGRGPVMDMVLTDPRVSRRHAVLRMQGDTLQVEDLSSTGGTAVNGVDVTAPTVLSRGDTLRLGDTEMTVLWGPDAAPGSAGYANTVPASAAITEEAPVPAALALSPEATSARPATPTPITVRVAGGRPPARPVTTGMLLAGGGVAGAVLALAATAMPALESASGTRNFWGLDVPGLGVLALVAGLLGLAACGAWLVAEIHATPPRLRALLALAAAACGGLIAGAPFFVLAASTPGYGAGGGLPTMLLAGCAVTACGVMRLVELSGGRRGVATGPPPLDALLVAAGGLGGLAVVVAAPMTWVTRNGVDLGGFDDAIGAGRWLVPLALTMVAACALTPLVGRLADRRTVASTAAVALALATTTLSFTVSAALTLNGDLVQTALMLALAGAALGVVACAIGAASIASGHPGGTPAAPAPDAGLPHLR